MSCCELEFACLIPKTKPGDLVEQPYLRYKGSEYKKTVRLRVPSWQPIKSRLKRFLNWISFVWSHSRSRKCRKICFTFLLSVFLTLFTIICVIIPLVFKYSVDVERSVIFNPTLAKRAHFDVAIEMYKDYHTKTYYKPKNMYVSVNKVNNVALGVWSMKSYKKKDYVSAPDKITNYIIYFHGSDGDRRSYPNVYSKLMSFFNVIAFDYRGYGDSSRAELREEDLVHDSVQLYKWLRSQTNANIYIWGDQLGAAIAAHTVIRLQEEGIKTCGVVLENPFTSMGEQLMYSWFVGKLTSYMFWYRATIQDPLEENDLSFNTSKYVSKIDCPVFFWEYGHHRANRFQINATYYYEGNSLPFAPSNHTISRLEFPYYYYDFNSKDDINSYESDYIRSVISYGSNYCTPNK